MPAKDERREELRAVLPLKIYFNVLESPEDYTRLQPPSQSRPDVSEAPQELSGRDEVERYLLYLNSKLDLILSLLATNITRKEYQYKGRILDISENGLRMVCPMPLKAGVTVEAGVALPNKPYQTIDIAGQVVWERAHQNETRSAGKYIVGIRFIDILPADQDDIVHHIFQIQREEIRRLKNNHF